MAKTAAIVVIGDEILSGAVADKNAAFLVAELRNLGVVLRRIEIVPDDIEAIADSVTRCSASADCTFTSGGVGPTHDDITMEGIARAFNVELEHDNVLRDLVAKHHGNDLTDSQLRLCQVPAGAEVVLGDAGWPLVTFRNLFILPGIPALFAKLATSLRDRLRDEPFAVGRVYLSCDESEAADALRAIVARHPLVKIGSYPHLNQRDYRVLVTIESKSQQAATAALLDTCETLDGLVHKSEAPGEVG